jgi:hypothetical protein
MTSETEKKSSRTIRILGYEMNLWWFLFFVVIIVYLILDWTGYIPSSWSLRANLYGETHNIGVPPVEEIESPVIPAMERAVGGFV